MARSIKTIKNENGKPRFSLKIEEKGRKLAEMAEDSWEHSPDKANAREIALTLNHINGVNRLHDKLEKNLSNLESYIHTKLMQLWPGKDEPLPYLWREQEKQKIREKERWQEKLLELEDKRGKLSASLEEKLQPLHEKLLELIESQYRKLQNGNKKNRKEA